MLNRFTEEASGQHLPDQISPFELSAKPEGQHLIRGVREGGKRRSKKVNFYHFKPSYVAHGVLEQLMLMGKLPFNSYF